MSAWLETSKGKKTRIWVKGQALQVKGGLKDRDLQREVDIFISQIYVFTFQKIINPHSYWFISKGFKLGIFLFYSLRFDYIREIRFPSFSPERK